MCKILTLDGYWPPSLKVEIAEFGGGMNCWDFFLASIFLSYVEPKLFQLTRENSPVQPLLRASWLVAVSPHPLEAIKTQDPVALSIFIISLLYLTPLNDG